MAPTSTPADHPSHLLPTREGYDAWSEIYDGEENPLVLLETPVVRAQVGNPSGLRIADIGCGTGRHAVWLAERGAIVTAVDFSAGMLARAADKRGSAAITFIEHDIRRPLPLGDGVFDRVLCCLVGDHVADLAGLFGELARICDPGGMVIFTVMHPAMMLRGVQARFTDPRTGRKVYPESVPNTMSDYLAGAEAGGLAVAELATHIVSDELAEASPRCAKYRGWPVLLAMRLTVA